MYSLEEYKKIRLKYGPFASWAIWNDENEKDTSIIESNFEDLNSKFVLIGLNISKSLINVPWINFHGGKHDRKIKYACNDTKLRGSYITDMFKDYPEVNSNLLKDIDPEIIKKNVEFFNQEMKDIKVNSNTQIISFGIQADIYFRKYFQSYWNNQYINYYHYSNYQIKDRDWVLGLWQKLGIADDFENTRKKYK